MRIVLKACLIAAAVWAGCSSSTDNPGPDTTPPPMPSGLVLDISNGAATLTWQRVSDSGLKSYNVYWIDAAVMDMAMAGRRSVTAPPVTIDGLDYETLYTFAVSAVDRAGNESPLSVAESGWPLNTKSPVPPANVDIAAENIDAPQITVFWAANMEPDMDVYNIYRAESAAELQVDGDPIGVVTATSYTDSEVEVGTRYFYLVTAVDKGGLESNPSGVVNDLALPMVELMLPLDFAFTAATPELRWEPVPGAMRYEVVVRESRIGGQVWTVEVGENTTAVRYNGRRLIDGNMYFWQVGAVSREEVNSISDTWRFTVDLQQ